MVNLVLRGERSKRRDVTLLFCGDRKIKEYHRKYFKKNTATDVISFGMPKTSLRGEKDYLGDVVVSAETARKVARRYGQAPFRECERYVVHGVLHLLGYDDKRPKDFKKMHEKQEMYLSKFDKLKASSKARKKR